MFMALSHIAIYDLIRKGSPWDFGDLAGSSCPGVPVMCFGLRTDFRSQLFEGSKRLMELADSIEEASARGDVCIASVVILAMFRLAKDMNRYTAYGIRLPHSGKGETPWSVSHYEVHVPCTK